MYCCYALLRIAVAVNTCSTVLLWTATLFYRFFEDHYQGHSLALDEPYLHRLCHQLTWAEESNCMWLHMMMMSMWHTSSCCSFWVRNGLLELGQQQRVTFKQESLQCQWVSQHGKGSKSCLRRICQKAFAQSGHQVVRAQTLTFPMYQILQLTLPFVHPLTCWRPSSSVQSVQ